MFKEKINHTTGQREWVVKEDDFDIAQELARSRFADMILDFNRNDMFLAGLQTVIAEKKSKGEEAHVMDIGTGTGLLSLMAAREGADKVTALEAFEPMGECARIITQNTEWKDKITVISKRSTDLAYSGEKANIIVAEVFDTELNGEGALRTFKEALQNLAVPGCRVIPSIGRIWLQPVSSNFLKQFNVISSADEDNSCPGTAAVFDLQLSRVDQSLFTPLTKPFLAFEFDYEDGDNLLYDETYLHEVEVIQSGVINAFLMWWELDMDRTNTNIISMAPSWCNEKYSWRDHWMQAVYFPPKTEYVKEGQTVKIACCHDEYSQWFTVYRDNTSTERPYCQCDLHNIFSRQSIYWHNQTHSLLKENEEWRSCIRKICEGKSIVALGEGSFIGIFLAEFAEKVFLIEPNSRFRSYLIKQKKLASNIKVLSHLDELTEKPDIIFAEPFYLSAMNPWQNLRFWHEAEIIRKRFGHDIPVFPKRGQLKAICEKFTNLYTTASPVGTVNGFDLSYFDRISHNFEKARQATDAVVDEHPLWEYEGKATSPEIIDICTFDLSLTPHDVLVKKYIKLNQANGIPIWIDWDYDGVIRTTGTIENNLIGKDPSWNIGAKQGVYLIAPELLARDEILLSLRYNSASGDIVFRFS